jgi:hypothetical protein
MVLESIMLSEISQTQKDKLYVFILYAESRLKKYEINIKEGLLERRRLDGGAKGEGDDGVKYEGSTLYEHTKVE